jgi:hypothetical protein
MKKCLCLAFLLIIAGFRPPLWAEAELPAPAIIQLGSESGSEEALPRVGMPILLNIIPGFGLGSAPPWAWWAICAPSA